MQLVREIERFEFPGPYRPSECRLRIYGFEPGQGWPSLVLIATELDDNPGMSITNAVESLWTEALRYALRELGLGRDVQRFFFEHYLCDPTQPIDSAFGEHYARVTFTGRDRDGKLSGPNWEHVTKAQVEFLIAPLFGTPRPSNLRELITHLTAHPRVTMHCDSPKIPVGGPGQNPETFLRFDDGLIWFRDAQGREHHLPLHCGLDAAALHESGIEVLDDGFDFEKFGVTIRVRYVMEA